jgi:hypothetical protein
VEYRSIGGQTRNHYSTTPALHSSPRLEFATKGVKIALDARYFDRLDDSARGRR